MPLSVYQFGRFAERTDLYKLLYNERGWPNYARLIKELKVPVDLGTPSTSFSGDTGRFEWASHSLLTLFGTWTNL